VGADRLPTIVRKCPAEINDLQEGGETHALFKKRKILGQTDRVGLSMIMTTCGLGRRRIVALKRARKGTGAWTKKT